METVKLRDTKSSDPLCPYCRSILDNAPLQCVSCETQYHRECWQEGGFKCNVFECDNMRGIRKHQPFTIGIRNGLVAALLTTILLVQASPFTTVPAFFLFTLPVAAGLFVLGLTQE